MRDPVREIVVAGVFFGALALLAWSEGLFARLGGTAVALAIFTAAMVAFTLAMDRELRAWLVASLAVLRKARAKSPAAKRVAT
jgi:hypothetical protein